MSHSAIIRKTSVAFVAAALAIGGLGAFTTPAEAAVHNATTSTVQTSTSPSKRAIAPLPTSLRKIQTPSTSKTGRVLVVLPAVSRGIPLPVDPTLQVR